MTTTQTRETALGDAIWELPPLILHPFADQASTERLLENSRSALMACGLLPGDADSRQDADRLLLDGRFSEIRMLFFLGKDVVRWAGQCAEFTGRLPLLANLGIREQSFAGLLTGHMPEAVSLKLQGWGVRDPGVIFARAVGLNQIFGQPPDFLLLSEGFVRHYHRYADYLFACWLQTATFREITSANFHFDLYASGEYTKLLENEWGSTLES